MKRMLLLLLPALSASVAFANDEFTVRFDDDLSGVEVRACFEGDVPDRLYRHEDASRFVEWIRHDGNALQTRSRGDELRLPDLPDDSCLDWRVNLGKAADAKDYRTAFRMDRSIVASTGLFFWKGSWERPVTVRVELPEGSAFSTPWSETGGAGSHRYTPIRTPSSWSSRIAVGPMHFERVNLGGARVNIAIPGDLETAETDKLTEWVTNSMDSVTEVFGYFPRSNVQVLIVPIGRRNEPVPWAHVMRGGGPCVEFFVDQTRSLRSFKADWTATHEFSHLLIPFVSSRDRWLSEGLASYYQNVLRARDGRLSEQQAWQKLHEGFERGVNGTRNETLADATRSGRGATMRVYWSGAAMMLLADTRLREQTNGEQNLDTALKALNECCLASGKRWRARDLMAELDRLTDTEIFSEIYQENVYARSFPDVSDVYDELGLETRRGRIHLQENARLARVRHYIMNS